MEFDDEDLPAGDTNNNDAVAASSARRPNTSRGGSTESMARTGSAERPKTSHKNAGSRLGSAQGERPYSRANSAYGNRPVTSGRLGSAVGHAGGGGYTAR